MTDLSPAIIREIADGCAAAHFPVISGRALSTLCAMAMRTAEVEAENEKLRREADNLSRALGKADLSAEQVARILSDERKA